MKARCPNCGRLFGVSKHQHPGCTAQLEIKCGRCGEMVIVPLDPALRPSTQST